MKQAEGAGPPRLPFALTIGVTGHRLAALAPDRRGQIDEDIAVAIETIERAATDLFERLASANVYSSTSPHFTMVSPLADGADQIAAEAAVSRGWHLQAVLPFDREEYARDFEDEDPALTYEELVAKAGCLLELPGDRQAEADAYLLAGRATVAHCDILIALWDGQPPRGRGGTAEIVDLAIVAGLPVVHVWSTSRDERCRLLWSGFDPRVQTRTGHERKIARPFDRTGLDWVMEAMLAPPADPLERRNFHSFQTEKARRVRGRIEFPLLLAIAGVKPIRSTNWRERACAEAIAEEWRAYQQDCAGRHGVDAPLGLLEAAYAWSDRLAGYYAQTFRSGHVFNFTLAAMAALIGLSAFLAPHRQFSLAVVEFLVAAAVVANTAFGTRQEWQRRWLDYRQLAERLRPMRSLKLLGVAAPDRPGSNLDPMPKRWVDWYAAGVWRAMGCPVGAVDRAQSRALIAAIRGREIEAQIEYNERAAQQADLLDRRLGTAFSALFGVTLLTAASVIVGLKLAPAWVAVHQDWLTLISAGLPAVATAIFGIRSAGDFAGSAQRSQSTAQTLKAIAVQLDEEDGDLARSADLIEQASRAMLVDLDEWRLVLKRSELEMA